MRQLLPIEMEFIADIADAQINGGSLLVSPNGDTRYDEPSQRSFDDAYDEVETLYREATDTLARELNRLEQRLEQVHGELKQVTQDAEQFQLWVKDLDKSVYEKAMTEVFGAHTCDYCRKRSEYNIEVDDMEVCDKCADEAVRCDRCDCLTLDSREYLHLGLCPNCFDETIR